MTEEQASAWHDIRDGERPAPGQRVVVWDVHLKCCKFAYATTGLFGSNFIAHHEKVTRRILAYKWQPEPEKPQ